MSTFDPLLNFSTDDSANSENHVPNNPRTTPVTEAEIVRVTVGEGSVFTAVEILPTWRKSITVIELGTLLTDAANKALYTSSPDDTSTIVESSTPGLDLTQRQYPSGVDATSTEARRLRSEIHDLADKFANDIATYFNNLRLALTTPAVGRGVNAKIMATLTVGGVVEIFIDRDWARFSRYTEIEVESLSALRDAQRKVNPADILGSVELPASLTRLRELASDPESLMRTLGLQ